MSAASTSAGSSEGAESGGYDSEASWSEEERLQESFEQLGAADGRLAEWASAEAKILAPRRSSRRFADPAESDSLPAIPDSARRVCLGCLQHLVGQYGLSQEEWFDAVTLFDSYVRKVGAHVEVADLPVLCAAILRMQWRGDVGARKARRAVVEDAAEGNAAACKAPSAEDWDWARASLAVVDRLAAEGHAVAAERAVPISLHALTHVQLALLSAVDWRVHVPNLAKWTTAYFKRLQALARAEDGPRVRAAWQRAMCWAFDFTCRQAPSRQCPPQRLARGFVLVLSESTCILPSAPPSVSGMLQLLEAVLGGPVDALQEDYILARRMLQQAGLLRVEHA